MAKKKEEQELQPLEALPSLETLESNLDALISGAMGVGDMPPAFLGSDPTGFYLKDMLFGPPGSGKTLALVALLLAGERLFIVSSDPGGDGLLTIHNELRRLKRLDLLKNYLRVNVPSYKTALALWLDPYKYYADALNALDPTTVVWEGFSYFQMQGIDEEVMPDDLRAAKEDGMDPFVFWDKVRRATVRVHDKWLKCHGRNADGSPKLWHHILTCHQGDPKEDKQSGVLKTRALVQGQAAKMVSAAYDLVLQTYIKSSLLSDPSESKYRYRCAGASDEFEVKNRGFEIGEEMDADFAIVWAKQKEIYNELVARATEKGENVE